MEPTSLSLVTVPTPLVFETIRLLGDLLLVLEVQDDRHRRREVQTREWPRSYSIVLTVDSNLRPRVTSDTSPVRPGVLVNRHESIWGATTPYLSTERSLVRASIVLSLCFCTIRTNK